MGACSCNRSVLVSLLWGSLHLYFCCVLLQKRGPGGGGGEKGAAMPLVLLPTYNALTGGETRGGCIPEQSPAGQCSAAFQRPKAAAGILELIVAARDKQLGHLPSIHCVRCDHI